MVAFNVVGKRWGSRGRGGTGALVPYVEGGADNEELEAGEVGVFLGALPDGGIHDGGGRRGGGTGGLGVAAESAGGG